MNRKQVVIFTNALCLIPEAFCAARTIVSDRRPAIARSLRGTLPLTSASSQRRTSARLFRIMKDDAQRVSMPAANPADAVP
jgi:hypothetical protein